MIIEDVRLVDDIEIPKTPPFHYTRVLDIITDNGTVRVPQKTTNRAEYAARSGVPLLKVLPSEIVSDFKILDEKAIDGFLKTDSDEGKELVGVIRQFNDITRRSLLRISIFQPAENVLDDWGTKEKLDFANHQAEYLQSKLGSTLITYPYLDLPVSEYIQFIDEKYVGNEKQSTIFALDMEMNPTNLKKILDHLQSKQEPMIIALIYRKWSDTIPQHIIVNSYFENTKMVFFGCQVHRVDDETGNTSNTHAVAVGANFDIVAHRQGTGVPVDQERELNNIKFYSPKSLRIDPLEPTLADPNRNIVSEFNFDLDEYLDIIHVNQILKGRNGAIAHPKKYQILFYLSRVHEAMTSPPVFSTEQADILEKNIVSHIQETNLRNVPMIRGF